MINTCSQILVRETNGSPAHSPEHMTVSSHWNLDSLVVLKLPNSHATYTVSARDLVTAITNATNSNKNG